MKLPTKSVLRVTSKRGELFLSSRRRRADLADGLMLNSRGASRTVYLSLETASPLVPTWSASALEETEREIRGDLRFDGYRISITRTTLGAKQGAQATTPFVWRLRISA